MYKGISTPIHRATEKRSSRKLGIALVIQIYSTGAMRISENPVTPEAKFLRNTLLEGP